MQNRNTIDNQLPRGAIPPQVNSPAHMVTDQVYASTTPDDTTNRYPCCNRPSAGPHSPDCMFNLYNHMIENYQTTKDLMTQYINQVTKDPMELEMERRLEEAKLEMYRQFLHQENSVPVAIQEKKVHNQRPPMVIPKLNLSRGCCGRQQISRGGNLQDCLQLLMGEDGVIGPRSQNRKLIEEQRRMKSLWVQFMNIFDMALDLADEASNARWQLNCRRKEDERLVCKRRMEEANRNWQKQRLDRLNSTQTYQQKSDQNPNKNDHRHTNKSDTHSQSESKENTQKTIRKQSADLGKDAPQEESELIQTQPEPQKDNNKKDGAEEEPKNNTEDDYKTTDKADEPPLREEQNEEGNKGDEE